MSRSFFLSAVLAGLAVAFGCGGDSSSPSSVAGVASVVFDIDGTLTPSPSEFFGVRPDAARAVQLYVDKGYAVIYLTARPKLLEGFTRDWLASHGFPDLPLYLADLSQTGDPAPFKIGVLSGLQADEDRTFVYAYGDSDTDFIAYDGVGIAVDHTFALLRSNESSCQPGEWQACLPGYTDHLAYIEAQPNAS